METDNINTTEDGSSTMDLSGLQIGMVMSSAAMILVVALTIAGNVFVITAVFLYKPLRTVPNFFIVSLAAADLAAAVVVMPFHISLNIRNDWTLGAIFCDIWLTSDVLICTASILNIGIIALDRYWAIHDPIAYAQKRTVKRVLLLIAAVWGASVVISVPPLLGWSNNGGESLYRPETMSCRLSTEKGYVIYSACGSFFIPLCVMTFVYLKIFLAMRRRLRKRVQKGQHKLLVANQETPLKTVRTPVKVISDNDNNKQTAVTEHDDNRLYVDNDAREQTSTSLIKIRDNGSPENKTSTTIKHFFEEKQRISLSKERKAARTLAIIMVTFIICWLPFFILYVIMPFCKICQTRLAVVEVVFVWLGYVNSMLNPIIYTVFNQEFRRAFHALMSGQCRKFHR